MKRIITLLASASLLVALTGCDYFGTHDGFEEDDAPRWGVQGMATYEIVGISPSSASEGEQVTVYTVSESEAPVDSFQVEDFWFCTFDGEGPMLETGGDEYESNVTSDDLIDSVDNIDLTVAELDDSIISTVTFTVPEDTVTGEGFVITPSNSTEYFHLTIQ